MMKQAYTKKHRPTMRQPVFREQLQTKLFEQAVFQPG
jgi:hypothetical protein